MRRLGSFALLIGCGVLAACGGSAEKTHAAWSLETLAPTDGFGLRIPDFEVPPGSEVQDCYFVRVPDINHGGDVWISRIKMAQNNGSHHMNIFRVKTILNLDPALGEPITIGDLDGTVVRGGPAPTGECWKSGNWGDWPLVTNTQNSKHNEPYTDWSLPEGVAARFSPGEMLMVQTHYVNAQTQVTATNGKLGVNLYVFKGSRSPLELGTVFATLPSVRVCQHNNPTPRYSGRCQFRGDAGVTITAANGHFHARGTRFEMYTWDGASDAAPSEADRFYRSTTWDDPPMKTDLAISPPPGGGVRWTCDYKWSEPPLGCDRVNARDAKKPNETEEAYRARLDCCYTFGPTVETSEHCNAFVYYYPKLADISCN